MLTLLFHHDLISSNPFQACYFESSFTMIHASVQFLLKAEWILNQQNKMC